MYLIIQQGGSSGEWYPTLFDRLEDAEDGVRGIKAHTYDAIGPFELAEALAKAIRNDPDAEGGLIEVLQQVAVAAHLGDFSELEPETCEVCGGGIDPNEEGCWQCQLS